MIFEPVSENELRIALAKWTLRYDRRCSYHLGINGGLDFIESFSVPKTDFIYVGTGTENDGKTYSVFKTSIKLSDWQSSDATERRFEFYRFDEVIPCETGDMPELKTAGYIII